MEALPPGGHVSEPAPAAEPALPGASTAAPGPERWTGWLLVGLTPATAVALELLRQAGLSTPVPFLLLLATVTLASGLGGGRAALCSALAASGYVIYSAWLGIGPPALTGSVLHAAAGCAVIGASAWALSRVNARLRRLCLASHNLKGEWSTLLTQLHRSERRARALLANAPDALCLLDADRGRMLDANSRALELFGCSREHWLTLGPADISPEFQPDGRSSRSLVEAWLARALAGEKPTFEWLHQDCNGRQFPAEVTLASLPEPGRRLVLAGIRDITARRRDEELRACEQQVLAAIAAAAPLEETLGMICRLVERSLSRAGTAVVLWQPAHGGSGTATPWIPRLPGRAQRLLRAASRTGGGLQALAALEPDACGCMLPDPESLPRAARRLLRRTGARQLCARRVLGPDRHPRALLLSASGDGPPLHEAACHAMGSAAQLLRIALERHHQHLALEHNEALYRGAFEQAAVGIGHVGRDGRWLRVNRKLCEITGYHAEQLLGADIRQLTDTGDAVSRSQDLRALFCGEQDVLVAEKRCRRRDGTALWVNLSASAVRDADGRVQHFVAVLEDISDKHRLSQQLSYQARHDRVTGLINRYEFEHRLSSLLRRVQDEGACGAVCYLDLDQFKLVNDTAGHLAGDELLRRLGHLLQEQIRASDTLARLGGDEFGILLADCPPEQAEAIAENLRLSVAEFRFQWDTGTFSLGASIGLVQLTQGPFASVGEILRTVDAACYAAKDQGRNRIVVYRDDDDELYRRHGEMEWVHRLSRALDQNLFRLDAQVIAPIDGAGPLHYELLLRLQDQGDTVMPGAFLPAAERYGLSPRIDRWVLDAALEWLRRNPGALPPGAFLSVNLSGLSVGDPQFRDYAAARLEGQPELASRLCFEITETAAIGSLSEASLLISRLRELGCLFALDDFGSGLSSFAYLKTLPVDFLKIDGVFIKDIDVDPFDRSIVEAINHIGRVMGKKTIAEFVESAAIHARLKDIGVDYAQGFWLGRPRPLEQLCCPDTATSGVGASHG